MKLIDGLKQRGKPFIIPDCSRNGLPELFVQMGFRIGAEIGVYRGQFSEKFCIAGLKMYAIDPWMAFRGQGKHQRMQEVEDGYYAETVKRLAPYPDCTIIKKTSMEALDDFRDGSLDFVYIDGDHNFRHAAEDIFEWSKKVRAGGVVSGHDYWNTNYYARNLVCNVGVIVDAYTKAFIITNWYIYKPDNSRDPNDLKFSWLWKKN